MDTTDEHEAYAEHTLFTDVLGAEPRVRMLAVFLSEPSNDLNPSDVARMAGIHRTVFYNHIDTLRDHELVQKTRTVGNSPMYQINRESEAAKALGRFESELITLAAEKEETESGG